MKQGKLALGALAVVASGLFAFNVITAGSVKGTITPADAGVRAWAISGTDTLKADIVDGAFTIGEAQPGTYQIVIEAQAPFKNAAKDGVEIKEGETTDVGEIALEQ